MNIFLLEKPQKGFELAKPLPFNLVIKNEYIIKQTACSNMFRHQNIIFNHNCCIVTLKINQTKTVDY